MPVSLLRGVVGDMHQAASRSDRRRDHDTKAHSGRREQKREPEPLTTALQVRRVAQTELSPA
jgi:hypothetical protein